MADGSAEHHNEETATEQPEPTAAAEQEEKPASPPPAAAAAEDEEQKEEKPKEAAEEEVAAEATKEKEEEEPSAAPAPAAAPKEKEEEEEEKPKPKQTPKRAPAGKRDVTPRYMSPRGRPAEQQRQQQRTTPVRATPSPRRTTTEAVPFASPTLMRPTKILEIRQELARKQIEEQRKNQAERRTWNATGRVDSSKLFPTPVNLYQPAAFFEEELRRTRRMERAESSPSSSSGHRWVPVGPLRRDPVLAMTSSPIRHAPPQPPSPAVAAAATDVSAADESAEVEVPSPSQQAQTQSARPLTAADPPSTPLTLTHTGRRHLSPTASMVHTEAFPWAMPQQEQRRRQRQMVRREL